MPSIRRAAGVSCPNTLEDLTESISQQHSGFTMMMKLNHRKWMLNECLAMVALEFEQMLTNSLAMNRLSVRIDFDWRQLAL